jgi:predicted Zn-dependent peptidase
VAARFSEYVSKVVFPSGLTLVTEYLPGALTTAVGVFVATGSQNESSAQAGISHVIEHMLFKGTRQRSAKALAEAMDAVGGRMNAYTAKDHTLFHASVPVEKSEFACEFLADMLWHSLLVPKDLALERNVILEEIKMGEDAADEYVHELVEQALWPGQPLGRLVIGTRETVSAIRRPAIKAYMRRFYHPGNVVLAVAGGRHHADVERWVRAYYPVSGTRRRRFVPKIKARFKPTRVFQSRDTEQANVCLAFPLRGVSEAQRAAQMVLNGILGGNMSSRLFQEVREKRGLAYSVGSYPSHYQKTGALVLYAGTSPDTLLKALRLMRALSQQLCERAVSSRELARAQEQLRGATYLSNETSMARMIWLGRSELQFNRYYAIGEFIDKVMGVTRTDVRREAQRVFNFLRPAVALTGPFKNNKILKDAGYA